MSPRALTWSLQLESNKLWKSSFAEFDNPNVDRLVASLRSMHANATHLTSRIAASLPGLTVHDITHLDALWEVAGVIAGDEFSLNPLEAYVFGGSILVHDAGLCFEAYLGGLDAVRDTVQWRDAKARFQATDLVKNVDNDADFEALRTLHASQAEKLSVQSWKSGDGAELFLINDIELREHYGGVIGKVAASHHWDIEQVYNEFNSVRPAAPFLDAGWTVDSLKLACLLRVADAGHIDSARAPSFLLKILQMNALSKSHWVAQNHLGRIRRSEEDPTQLVVSSMGPFTREEASAWWVAYDAICLLDKELKDSNLLLDKVGNNDRASFAARGVAGAGNVKETARYVQTIGWEPSDASVHVSDVAALVLKLGGEQLYGKEAVSLEIALRELIQNAADSVMARRVVDKDIYEGSVSVRLKLNESGDYLLQINDDGLGMSQQTLVRELLDFGRSFWASERVAREFPGLQASGYTSIGRFGIGFFSVFMAASKVAVYSRRFDSGIDKVRCLSFERGMSLRPILSAIRPEDMGMSVSTRVELELKLGVLNDADHVRIQTGPLEEHVLEIDLPDYLAALVCGLPVHVSFESDGHERTVHQSFPPQPSKRRDWLRQLSFDSEGLNQTSSADIDLYAGRLRELSDGKRCFGLAAIRIDNEQHGRFLSTKSVGGLATPCHPIHYESFVGLIDHSPAGVQRKAGEIAAPKECLHVWLNEQADILKEAKISVKESIYASYSFMHFDFDPIEILQGVPVRVSEKVTMESWEDLRQLMNEGFRLMFPIVNFGKSMVDTQFHGDKNLSHSLVCIALGHGTFNNAELLENKPQLASSLIGVIHRKFSVADAQVHWLVHKGVYHGLWHVGDYLEVTVH